MNQNKFHYYFKTLTQHGRFIHVIHVKVCNIDSTKCNCIRHRRYKGYYFTRFSHLKSTTLSVIK